MLSPHYTAPQRARTASSRPRREADGRSASSTRGGANAGQLDPRAQAPPGCASDYGAFDETTSHTAGVFGLTSNVPPAISTPRFRMRHLMSRTGSGGRIPIGSRASPSQSRYTPSCPAGPMRQAQATGCPPLGRGGLIAFGAAAALIFVLAVAFMLRSGAPSSGANVDPSGSRPEGASSFGSATPAPLFGPLPAGTYTTQVFLPGSKFTVADSWSVVDELEAFLTLTHAGTTGRYLNFVKVSGLVDRSDPNGVALDLENPGFDNVRNWLANHPCLTVTDEGTYPPRRSTTCRLAAGPRGGDHHR